MASQTNFVTFELQFPPLQGGLTLHTGLLGELMDRQASKMPSAVFWH